MTKRGYPDPDSMSNLVVAITQPMTSNFPNPDINPNPEEELEANNRFRRRRPGFKS